MATSDERRDVATRLRKTRGIMAFVDALGIDPDGDWCWTDVSRRVADLIDPTCHIVCVDDSYNAPETGHVDEWHYECSRCGIELDDNDTDAMDSGAKPFDYCKKCGARVIGGSDGD